MKIHFVIMLFAVLNNLTTQAQESQLIIKTIMAKGSISVNEFGNQADWIEIKNTGNEAIDLGQDKWYISDNPKRPRKYKLPKMVIAPKQSIIVWCDDEGRVKKEIHANFKLSSSGETIVLSCKKDDEIKVIDSVSYQPSDIDVQMAICRTENGLEYKALPSK